MNPLQKRREMRFQNSKQGRAQELFEEAVSLFYAKKFDETIEKLLKVVKLQPSHAVALNNIADCHRIQKRFDEAISYFHKSIAADPKYFDAYFGLSLCFRALGRLEESEIILKKLLMENPKYGMTYGNLAHICDEKGRFEEAEIYRREGYKNNPSPGMAIDAFCNFSPLLRSLEHEEQIEKDFLKALEMLREMNFRGKGFPPNFFNVTFFGAYHKGSPRLLMEPLGRTLAEIYPDLNYVSPHLKTGMSKPKERIKIGICSSFILNERHSVFRSFGGIALGLDPKKFEVHIINLSHQGNVEGTWQGLPITNVESELEIGRLKIADLELDILFYTDIGMECFSYFLGFSRLAPIQCVGNGHPITSGIPTLDYYISSEDLERENGQDFYTETLVKLKGIGSCYQKPIFEETIKSLTEFGIPEGVTYYVCPQTLFKFHPEMDFAIREILRRDPKGVFIAFEYNEGWQRPMLLRWQQTLREVIDRVYLMPRLDLPVFLQILKHATVVLDSFPFCGGNTSYQAFAAEVPIVTLKGDTCRGLGTYSLCKKMDVLELAVDQVEDYIDLCLKIGRDEAYRQTLKEKIARRNHLIFEDQSVVREYERFFEEAYASYAERHRKSA